MGHLRVELAVLDTRVGEPAAHRRFFDPLGADPTDCARRRALLFGRLDVGRRPALFGRRSVWSSRRAGPRPRIRRRRRPSDGRRPAGHHVVDLEPARSYPPARSMTAAAGDGARMIPARMSMPAPDVAPRDPPRTGGCAAGIPPTRPRLTPRASRRCQSGPWARHPP
jgi:hypothetical protein